MDECKPLPPGPVPVSLNGGGGSIVRLSSGGGGGSVSLSCLNVAAQFEFESRDRKRFIIVQIQALNPITVNPCSTWGQSAPPYLGGLGVGLLERRVRFRGAAAQVEFESRS